MCQVRTRSQCGSCCVIRRPSVLLRATNYRYLTAVAFVLRSLELGQKMAQKHL